MEVIPNASDRPISPATSPGHVRRLLAVKEARKDFFSSPLKASDRSERTSFSSIKEDVSTGLAQSFTNSKISSFSRLGFNRSPEEAIDVGDDNDDDNDEELIEIKSSSSFRYLANMLMPSFVRDHSDVRADLKGWKDVPIKGRIQSHSFGDLKSAWGSMMTMKKRNSTGALLESLPMEILANIFSLLALDIPPENYAPRNLDLISLLLTSSTIHSATLSILYRNITVPHSRIYSKFLQQISIPSQLPLAQMVQRLDFSHFNPTECGLTARERRETKNLTAESLLHGLKLMRNLQEFLGQEHIDDDLSADVLSKLFTALPRLRALDLCACSSTTFRDAFASFLATPLPEVFTITRLSLHECTILPSIVFERILPRLQRLTHLDVSHTRISDQALMSIPSTARITHLNLSKCSSLSGSAVTHFLITHAAIVGNGTCAHPGLVYLNLRSDAKTHSLLSAADLSELLPRLPKTLRSLNLSGSSMSSVAEPTPLSNPHILSLIPLTKHLEELSVGRHIPLVVINEIFSTSQISTCTLRYLDISDLDAQEGVSICTLLDKRNCYLLRPWSLPLEVVEVSEKISEMARTRARGFEGVGWTVMEAGRRGWLVRDMREVAGGMTTATRYQNGSGDGGVCDRVPKKVDEGDREWKMGAQFWGMRKVPVAKMEVGGMYGLYMFKR